MTRTADERQQHLAELAHRGVPVEKALGLLGKLERPDYVAMREAWARSFGDDGA